LLHGINEANRGFTMTKASMNREASSGRD